MVQVICIPTTSRYEVWKPGPKYIEIQIVTKTIHITLHFVTSHEKNNQFLLKVFLKGRQNTPSHISHFEIYTWNKQEATIDNVLRNGLCTDIFFKYFESSPSFDSNASENKWIPHDSEFSGQVNFFLFLFPSTQAAPHCTKICIFSVSNSVCKSQPLKEFSWRVAALKLQQLLMQKQHKFCKQVAMQKLHYYTTTRNFSNKIPLLHARVF